MSAVDHRARLGNNTLWLLVARVGTQALMVVFTIIVARRLGETGLGEYAFIAAAIVLANVLTSFGTDMLLVRDIAASGRLSQLAAALALQVALSLGFIALALVAAPHVPNQSRDAITALQIYSLALLPLAAYTVFAAALRGLGHFGAYTALNLTIPATQVTLAWFFVPPGSSVVALAVVLVATQFLAAILGGALCTAGITRFWNAWREPSADIGPLVRASAPVALLGLLGMLYQRSSVYLLATIAGPAVTGSFSAALRAVEAAKTGHLAFFGALYPALAQTEPRTRGSLRAGRSLWSLVALAVAAAAALSVLADPLIAFLYGPAFGSAAGALRILAWTLVPYTVSSYLSLALVAARRERPVNEALVGGLAVLVALNVWLIPIAGLLGSCWATLTAETFLATLLVWRSRGIAIRPERSAVLHHRELPGLP
jgi:O-antigen/teichoic acid export membrane protein